MCEDFARYFKDVIDTLLEYFSPTRIFDMDESGVTARPFKGKKRKVASLTNCQIELRFQDARDVTHVFIVATMPFGLNSLPPLFLRVSDLTFKDAELRQLQDEFHTFRAPQGDTTTPPMAFYVQNIIAPYTGFLRTCFNDHDLQFDLILDIHSVRNNPEILPLYGQYEIVPISFPPRSAHCLQPLDL